MIIQLIWMCTSGAQSCAFSVMVSGFICYNRDATLSLIVPAALQLMLLVDPSETLYILLAASIHRNADWLSTRHVSSQ